ncbi:CC171 protein, partial [Aegithalos caudatus]|nr:CC171 protein [Aegithalos caudatus]
AVLQQEVFELSQRLHAAEVECHSMQLQLADFQWTFIEMQKDAEKAHRLQEQLNALQHVNTTYFSFQKIVTQDNINEELENALQREQEARLLLQEYEQRLQELSNRLGLHSSAETHRSQDLKAEKSLSNVMEELRRRDQFLNHQKRLLKDMEQDWQQLRETLQEAEHALQQAAHFKGFMHQGNNAICIVLNEMFNKLNKMPNDLIKAGAAAATPLPRLQLEILSEEAMRDKPEVLAFQVRV